MNIAVGNRIVSSAYLKQKAAVPLDTPEGYAPFRDDNVSHQEVLETIEAPQAWNDGYDGAGVGIAILDTGGAPHPSIANRIRVFKDFSTDQETQLMDSHWHGTAMAGAAAASGAFPGVAPAAHILLLKVADRSAGFYQESVSQALDWVAENQERYQIGVVNMSFGLDDPNEEAIIPRVEESLKKVVDVGVIPLAAVGNEGRAPISLLAASPLTLAVGGSDGNGTSSAADDQLLEVSSRPANPTAPGPDLLAPGIGMVRPIPGKKFLVTADGGTSSATAVVSGAVALWKQADPDLDLRAVRALIKESSEMLASVPSSAQGAGDIRVHRALGNIKKGVNPA